MMNTLDLIDTTAYESEAEREEREVAMFAEVPAEDWDAHLSDSHTDPMEWEDR